MRAWIVALSFIAGLAPFLADAGGAGAPSAADQKAIRGIIEAQLDAFQRNDSSAAFSYASPTIQQKFGSPANFMAMVEGGYAPVYRPRQVEFLDSRVKDGQTAQAVKFVGPDGKSVIAIYSMEQQPDGSWRISGVFLIATDETTS